MKKNPKVFIYVQSYSCEKYIRRALDSILNQTYQNWICIICDNGAKDSTPQIIKEYQQKDKRFIVKFFEESRKLMYEEGFPLVYELSDSDEDLFASIDADDEIDANYLLHMLEFREKHELDIVCCGNYFIDPDSNEVFGQRSVENNMIIKEEQFGELFPKYHQFSRTHWGKIIPLYVLKNMNILPIYETAYGVDTLYAQEAFLRANSVGILNENLYFYYYYKVKKTYNEGNERIYADAILHERALDYLLSKVGHVSDKNMKFLYLVYFSALKDTFNVIKESKHSPEDSIKLVHEMVCNHTTRTFINIIQKDKWMTEVAGWIIEKCVSNNMTEIEQLAEVLATLHLYPAECGIMNKVQLFKLLTATRKYWYHGDSKKKLDATIVELAYSEPLLKGIDIGGIIRFADITEYLMIKEYESAYFELKKKIEQIESFSPVVQESLLEMTLRLSAFLEKEEDYIIISKKALFIRLQNGQRERVKDELEEWLQLLPDDEELQKIKILLNNV